MKTKGMAHQITGLVRMDGKRNFALLMQQGTGKTWLSLADAERCFLANKIDAICVIAPNGVHTNWVRREIPTHLEIPSNCYVWRGKPSSKKGQAEYEKLFARMDERPGLRVFSINVEAANTPAGYEAIEKFIDSFRVMVIVDESTRIKNPQAKRTKKVIKLGRSATARRILTGTPITKGPPDVYSQFDFLKEGLLGTTSYRAFVSEFAVLVDPDSKKMQGILRKLGGKTRGIPQIVEEDEQGRKMWKNLDRLSNLVAAHSYRVRKEDCLDLPPKQYQSTFFELTPEQRRVYDRLQSDYSYISQTEGEMSLKAIATRTKMKQVTSGFVNVFGNPELMSDGDNPRLDAFKEIIEDIDGSFIVWAMFAEEIRQVCAALEAAGISYATYTGSTSAADRERAIDDLQSGKVTAFVGHAAAAGIGITLTAAETTIYYSCSFDNELRLQSEDRNHRIGTVNSVLYIDLVAENTVDEDITKSLAVKDAVAYKIIDERLDVAKNAPTGDRSTV